MPVLQLFSHQLALAIGLARRLGVLMGMRVMAEVRALLRGQALMPAVAGGCNPGGLQQHQQSEKRHDAATHGVSLSAATRGQRPLPARSSRKPLKTTSRLAPMSANTAIHMVALPNTASTKNTALMPRASEMFCQRMA